jgi:hypothetical protein
MANPYSEDKLRRSFHDALRVAERTRGVAKRSPEAALSGRSLDALEAHLEYLLGELKLTKKVKKDADLDEKELTAEALPLMKSKTFVFDGGTATRVDPTTLETDQEALKKKIGVRNYNRITKVVIDKKLLEANIAAGFIDPQDVADCSEVIPKASYILIT